MDKLKDRNFNCLVGDKNEISWSNMDTSEIELEEELLKTHVSIDVNKLAKGFVQPTKMNAQTHNKTETIIFLPFFITNPHLHFIIIKIKFYLKHLIFIRSFTLFREYSYK